MLKNIQAKLPILIMYIVALMEFTDYHQGLLYTAIPLAFALSFFGSKNKKINNKFLLSYILLVIWISLTYFASIYSGLALAQIKRLFGCLMFILIFYWNSSSLASIRWLYLVYIFYYLSMIIYTYDNPDLLFFDYTSERLNTDELNANTIAYFTFFLTFVIYIIPSLVKNAVLIKLMRILFWLVLPLSFVVAILTASRQVVIVQLPLIVLLLYYRYLYNSTFTRKILLVLVLGAAIFYALPYIQSIYESSMLAHRTSEELAVDDRKDLLQKGILTGLSNPVYGVGPNNFGMVNYGYPTFAHNSYVEVFANEGVLGLLIYIYMTFGFCIQQWIRFREKKDTQYIIFLIFGCIYILDNMFYVFYTNTWLMSFFFLVLMHSDCYYRGLEKEPEVVKERTPSQSSMLSRIEKFEKIYLARLQSKKNENIDI